MENGKNSTEEKLSNERIPMNEETARYLWNLAQKANLTVTTAATSIRQEEKKLNEDPQTTSDTNVSVTCKSKTEISKKDHKDHQNQQQQQPATTITNPFAALPVSLIKNGILSVTSDTACVKIENGVAILKEAHENPLSTTTTATPKDAITIEPVIKQTNTLNTTQSTPIKVSENPKTSQRLQQRTTSTAVTENLANVAELQHKLLLERHILKTLLKPNAATLISQSNLVPTTNQTEFSALLGLEIVTDFCRSQTKDINKATMLPSFCVQCGTDFTSRWHRSTDTLQIYCERCYFVIILRSQHIQQRIKHLQKEVSILHKQFKLPLPLPKLPTQLPQIEAQQLFKKYLNILINTENNFNNNIGFSELTKLGASIAVNAEVQKALDNMKSLHCDASAEMRAKAVQDIQFAFYEGLNEAFQNLGTQGHEKSSLLRHYQLIIAQMAKNADLSYLNKSTENASNITETPLIAFERTISQQHQRLIKIIQNLSN